MSKPNKHKILSFSAFLDYLRDRLSDSERNKLERQLEKDDFDREAMEGFESMNATDLEHDILELEQLIYIESKGKRTFPYLKIAASIALIFSIAATFFFLSDRKLEDIPFPKEVTENIKEEAAKPAENPQEKTQTETDLTEKEAKPSVTEEAVEEIEGMDDVEEEIQIVEDDLDLPQTTALENKTELASGNGKNEVLPESRVAVPQRSSTMQQHSIEKKTAQDASSVQAEEDPVGFPQEIISTEIQEKEDALSDDNAAHQQRKSAMGKSPERVRASNPKEDSYQFNSSTEQVSPEERVSASAVVDGMLIKDEKDFEEYANENLVFPESTLNRGVVVLQFSISESNRPINISVIRSTAPEFSKEAIRLLHEGPDWMHVLNSGKKNSNDKRVRIVFK